MTDQVDSLFIILNRPTEMAFHLISSAFPTQRLKAEV
uniref:Uncharacterized protein n=1 Tax=Anguilla anguilla TaxID=7936 RepID=A0A0E9QLW4_ANGAN